MSHYGNMHTYLDRAERLGKIRGKMELLNSLVYRLSVEKEITLDHLDQVFKNTKKDFEKEVANWQIEING